LHFVEQLGKLSGKSKLEDRARQHVLDVTQGIGNLHNILVSNRGLKFLELFCDQRNPQPTTVFSRDRRRLQNRMFERSMKIGDHSQGIRLFHKDKWVGSQNNSKNQCSNKAY